MPTYAIISIIICALISVYMCYWLVASGFKTYQFVREAKTAMGMVVELHEEIERKQRKDSNGHYRYVTEKSYYPVIEFTTESGKPVVFRGAKGYDPPRYRVEDPVAVIYQVGEEEIKTKINSFDELWSDLIATAVVSGIFLILCFVIYYFSSKNTPGFDE